MISLEDDIAQSMENAMILNSFIKRLSAPGPATLWLEGVADEVLAMPQDAARAAALRVEPIFVVSSKAGCRYRKERAMKLIDLSPRHMAEPGLGLTPFVDDPPRLYHEIAFLCPKCRKHEISVAFWDGPQRDAVQVGVAEYGPVIKRMWHREGDRGFLDLTLTPSVNREQCGDKCGGWHGSITDGEVA